MATNRKLQAEIDRTLKRIQEGIEEFDGMWQKVHAAPKANLKEKYETELKKEIKKLQRYRDQVKTWASSSEIKNKQPLIDARKLIEKDMERFRVFEKEAKTKQYSTEGLANRTLKEFEEQHHEYDPEVDEMIEWIDQIKERIQALSSKLEEESQQFSGTKKKKQTSSDKEKFNALQKKIDRFQWHIGQLNDVEEKLNERRITAGSLKTVKDDVEFWVEKHENEEEDLDEEDDEYFYDVLKEQLLSPEHKDADLSAEETEEHTEDEEDQNEDVKDEPVLSKESSAEVEQPSKKQTAAAVATTSVKSKEPEKVEPVKEVKPATKPALVSRTSESSVSSTASKPSITKTDDTHKETVAESVAPVKSTPIKPFSAIVKKNSESPAPTHIEVPAFPELPSKPLETKVTPPSSASLSQQKAPAPSAASIVSGSGNLPGLSSPGAFGQPRSVQIIGRRVEEKAPESKPVEPPKSKWTFGQAAAPAPVSRAKPKLPREYDAELMKEHRMCLEMLESSMKTMPPIESDRQKSYIPRNPYRTPDSFPSVPSKTLDEKSVFEKLDIDTLFFIFYFQQGTYQQYLAAQQLKKQSWRFHTKYLTWFQRHEDPKLTTDEFEQGTYVYFDYDYSWCQRIKTDFTFEYSFLEDELQV